MSIIFLIFSIPRSTEPVFTDVFSCDCLIMSIASSHTFLCSTFCRHVPRRLKSCKKSVRVWLSGYLYHSLLFHCPSLCYKNAWWLRRFPCYSCGIANRDCSCTCNFYCHRKILPNEYLLQVLSVSGDGFQKDTFKMAIIQFRFYGISDH